MKKIFIALTFLAMIFSYTVAFAADVKVLSVINISTPDKLGYAIYWPKDMGSVNLEKSDRGDNFSTLVQTDQSFYIDHDVKQGVTYTYRVRDLVATSSDESAGQPVISNIAVKAGATSKDESSVIITFNTDKLSKSQAFFGESLSYGNQTELDQSLNQSHTVLVEKLKPNTTYHLKVKAQDKTDKYVAESADQTFTTPKPPVDQSILQIIIQALMNAFSGFDKWLKS